MTKDNGKRPSIDLKEECDWINIEDAIFEKNFTKYMMMFREQVITGTSEVSTEEFLYWNDEWNSNKNK